MALKNHGKIDEILSILGDIGPYQWKIYSLSMWPIFLAGILTTALVFSTSVPEHRCFIEGCDDDPSLPSSSSLFSFKIIQSDSYQKFFLNYTIPKSNDRHRFDQCHRYASLPVNTSNSSNFVCSEIGFDSETIQSCHNRYVHNQHYFRSTLATEFNLLCENEWTIQLLQSLFFFGVLLGAINNGILADKFGRKMIFRIYSPLLIVSILFSLTNYSIYLYSIGLLLKGLCVAALYQSAFTFGIECLGGNWRFWLANFYSIVFTIGAIYSCLMAYLFRSWFEIEITNLFPALLMIPFPWVVPESIRWQFSAGRTKEALEQVVSAAKKNGVKIPAKLKEVFLNEFDVPEESHQPNVSIMDLFKHKSIRHWSLTFLYIWFTNALVYYGISFLASKIHDDIYLSMIALMAVEVPGVLIAAFLGEFSRRNALIGTMVLGGCASIISSFSPGGYIRMGLAITGKLCISASFSLIYVYAAEIFPTILRATGIGMCSLCARVGAMIAPYLFRLHFLGGAFPFLVIGVVTLLAGILSFILPETKGKKLPDTLEEVSQLRDDSNQCFRNFRKKLAHFSS